MNFLTAEVVIDVNLTKVKSQLKEVTRAERQAYAERDRMATRLFKEHGKAIEDNKRFAIKAAKDSAKKVAAAHKAMVTKLKRNFAVLQKAASRAYGIMASTARRAFSTATKYVKIAAVAILAGAAASVKLAMDAEESQNLFEVSMGKMATAATEFSEAMAAALYMNPYEIRKNVATFNVMFESMGHGTQAAYDMATGLTTLAYDMASFYNLRPEEAFNKIRSGMVGMSRPLKDLGILLEETTVKQYALNNGIFDGVGEMTQIQKVQARYGALLAQTTKAQGDMARTLDDTTNVFRSLWDLIKETAIGIGNKLLPAVNKAAIAMRDWLVDNKERIIDWAETVAEKLDAVIEKVKDFIAVFKEDFSKGMVTLKYVIFAVGRAIVDSLIILGKEAGRGFAIAFGAELGKWMYEMGKPEGPLGKLSMGIPAIGATRLRLMRSGVALIEKSRMDAEISAAKQLAAAWREVEEAIPGRKNDNDNDIDWKLPDPIDTTGPRWENIPSMVLPPTSPAFVEPYVPYKERPQPEMTDEMYADAMAAANRWNDFEVAAVEELVRVKKEAAETVARNQEAVAAAQKASAAESIDFIRAQTFMSHTEKLAMMDEEIMAKRDLWAEESEAMALLAEERQRYADQHKEGWDALGQTMSNWFQDAQDWGKNLGDVLVNAFDRAADAFADSLMRQKVDWKAFGRSFIKELIAMIMRLMMAVALKKALEGWSGLFNPTPTPTAAGPGILTGMESADFQTGYASGGHVLETGIAKVHRGEDIVSAGSSGGLIVNVIDQSSGKKVDVSVEENPDERTYNVILNALGSDGPMRRAVSSVRS